MKTNNSKKIRSSGTHVPRYFLFALTILCWFAALIQCLESPKNNSIFSSFIETTVPAFSTHRFQNSFTHCVYSHETDDFYDYYLYSPLIDAAGIQPIGQGYNLHVAITKDGEVYFGFPDITCDF